MTTPVPTPNPARAERLTEFFRRVEAAPECDSAAQAYALLSRVMNAVESELTDIPYDPVGLKDPRGQTERMYPSFEDNVKRSRRIPGRIILKSRKHLTRIDDNGAIEVVVAVEPSKGRIELMKAGSEGARPWNLPQE